MSNFSEFSNASHLQYDLFQCEKKANDSNRQRLFIETWAILYVESLAASKSLILNLICNRIQTG